MIHRSGINRRSVGAQWTISCAAFALLAGCGQVVVFGHVVHEAPAKPAAAPEAPSPSSTPAVALPAAPATAPAAAAAAPKAARPATKSPAVTHVVKSVAVTITPAAAAKVANTSPRFSTEELLAELNTELAARRLLDEHDSKAGTAEIVIDTIAVAPTVNAVVFGYRMMAGQLSGTLRVHGPGGSQAFEVEIDAASRWRIAADAVDDHPLSQLYHRFAVLAGDRLAGVASAPDQATQDVPR